MANIVLKNSEGKEQIYRGVTTLKLQTLDGSIAEFVEKPIVYTSGEPKIIEISALSWYHSEQRISINDVTTATNVQIGVPPNSSLSNMEEVIKSGLRISNISISSSSNSVVLYITATNIPTKDISVAIWGLA